MILSPGLSARVSEQVIVMKGAGDKAFCAGGDINAIRQNRVQNKSVDDICKCFRTEYVLSQLIGNLPENVVHMAL